MNDNIKFRGLRLDNKEWAYGSLLSRKDGTASIIYEDERGDLQRKHVVPKTVGLYIGLKDRNAKEIYTDDILEDSTEFVDSETLIEGQNTVYRGVVKFGEWGCGSCHSVYGFHVDAEESNENLGWDVPNLENHSEIEIIGNIHEHPERLKVDRADNYDE